MKRTAQHIGRKEGGLLAVLACCALLLPAPARAQCENPLDVSGLPTSATEMLIVKERADINTFFLQYPSATSAAAQFDLQTLLLARLQIGNALNTMTTTILNEVKGFWTNWMNAFRGMAAQLTAGSLEQSRERLSFIDAENRINTANEMQMQQVSSKFDYQPTAQACRFDTTAFALQNKRAFSSALMSGFAQDFMLIGNNQRDHIGDQGSRSQQRERWRLYETKFCNPNDNNGAGCTGAHPNAYRQLAPSATIFGAETIDFSNIDTYDAVTQLLFNITGYEAPEPILVGALGMEGGKEQRQANREYLAQMDAIGALAYSVVAERASAQTPGLAWVVAPEVRNMRWRRGIANATSAPSSREIREAIVEQLWDPDYYTDLYDNPATINQKELHLKAYSLVMLYDLIEKQEKISNAYAIQTARMLHAGAGGRGAAAEAAPLK